MTDDAEAGSPVRTFDYELTLQDAVAYSVLKHEMTRMEKLKVVVLVGGAGMVAASLPQDWPSVWWWSAVAGILAGAAALALLWSNLYARRGGATIGAPTGRVRLEEWDDRLVEHSAKGARTVPLERVSEVIATPDHLFLRLASVPIIMPRAAFANVYDMADFAERIDKASMPVIP